MSDKPHSDQGTVLKPSQSALVYDPDEVLITIVLSYRDEDAVMPSLLAAMLACGMRLMDPEEDEFRDEMIEWLERQRSS